MNKKDMLRKNKLVEKEDGEFQPIKSFMRIGGDKNNNDERDNSSEDEITIMPDSEGQEEENLPGEENIDLGEEGQGSADEESEDVYYDTFDEDRANGLSELEGLINDEEGPYESDGLEAEGNCGCGNDSECNKCSNNSDNSCDSCNDSEDDNSEDNDSEDDNSEDNDSEDDNSEDNDSEDDNSEDNDPEDNNSEDNDSEDDNSEDNDSENDKPTICNGVMSIKNDFDLKIDNRDKKIKSLYENLNIINQAVDNQTQNINSLKNYNKKSISDLYKNIDSVTAKLEHIKEMTDAQIEEVKSMISSSSGGSFKRVEITHKTDKKTTTKTINEYTHEKFELVLKYVSRGRPVLMYGPTGSGKTFMAKQISDSNDDWDWYFCNQVTEEYKLTGFINATGEYQPTSFFEAFTKGGLFCIDEIDASIPEVIICLNMALANGEFNFPHGMFKMHENFRVIACANTISGADNEYTGRSQLDKATLDRFIMVEIDYDAELEKNMFTEGTFELITQLRRYIDTKARVNMSFSTRCGLYFDEYKSVGVEYENLVTDILLKGADIRDFEDFGVNKPGDEILNVRRAIHSLLGKELPEDIKKREEKLRKAREEQARLERMKEIENKSKNLADSKILEKMSDEQIRNLSDTDLELLRLHEKLNLNL